ncbi:family 43 glycosylhydrolase [Mucilaginibacter terrae]|uniref:Glycosyl hydrolase family 43 n=1 Tax=Mucilaginibacter terrae TaxID=1955052 RepID=A0ABU3GV97_9SPHI|nr:family 43 glycosylhydrolase [Mucilaginibacter terrae]MDT3402560.1 hypothetical protein [Mucilaginibacter terrae]
MNLLLLNYTLPKVVRMVLMLALMLSFYKSSAQKQTAIYSGVPWFDDRGSVVSAHGGGIIKEGSKYYLFGEKHTDQSNAFAGFNCYSSTDLYNWKFESLALPVQDSGKLGLNRVGERVKVMKCPKTGEYVMFMHADDISYKDQFVGYATSKTIVGPYVFKGALLFNGKPIRKWDMGTYQDTDGAGYVLLHGGLLFKLADDYKSITEQVVDNKWPGSESPAIFKNNGVYFWLASNLTSWERNDNFYYTATSLKGPWTAHGLFAPEGTLTWNSQTTFVLPIEGTKDTTFIFMGDRWSYPNQASAATYVWQPLTVSGNTLSMAGYQAAWKINTGTGAASPGAITGKTITAVHKSIICKGQWEHASDENLPVLQSGSKGDTFTLQFSGKQVFMYGISNPDGGYAMVDVTNHKGKIVASAMIDMYSKYKVTALKFLSPVLPKANYTLTLTVLGEHSKWSDKRKTDYGSKGDVIAVQKFVVN